jgi:hypothetical protein
MRGSIWFKTYIVGMIGSGEEAVCFLAKAGERLGAIEDLLYAAGRMECSAHNNTLPVDQRL